MHRSLVLFLRRGRPEEGSLEGGNIKGGSFDRGCLERCSREGCNFGGGKSLRGNLDGDLDDELPRNAASKEEACNDASLQDAAGWLINCQEPGGARRLPLKLVLLTTS